MTIAFIHPHKAFLPEVDAYRDFFSSCNIETIVEKADEKNKINADVEWHFMGTDNEAKKNGVIKIHEYASASLPPLRKLKDFIKKTVTTKPDFRLFLNNYVRLQLNFNDAIPFGFRDMGIYFSNINLQEATYDFIYCGSASKDMMFDILLKCFTKNNLLKKTLLVLSRDYEKYAQRYRHYTNIIFKGPVEKNKVADYIRDAKFAINYKPNIEPHSFQTSTKLLEYAACHARVITSDFPWIRDFQKKYGGNYFYLLPDLSNLTWENVNKYEYAFPDLAEWSWEKQIRKSGVLEFLQSKFPQILF
jgi:hypothetical protein